MPVTLLEARDFLLQHREDYATARREFRWPELEEFNFAWDWFDVLASGKQKDQDALVIVTDSPGGGAPHIDKIALPLRPQRRVLGNPLNEICEKAPAPLVARADAFRKIPQGTFLRFGEFDLLESIGGYDGYSFSGDGLGHKISCRDTPDRR